MKQATGECKYCGQLKSVSVADDATQEEINEIVTGTCTCEDAKYQAGITRIIKSTESKIDMLFESDNESPEKCLLKKAAPILVNGFIRIRYVLPRGSEIAEIIVTINNLPV